MIEVRGLKKAFGEVRAVDGVDLRVPDGVITGRARIDGAEAAVIVNDYSVLAGTQGLNNHRKKDRLLEIAEQNRLPTILLAEGGGGRDQDRDEEDGSWEEGL